jgi:hypothetical protein
MTLTTETLSAIEAELVTAGDDVVVPAAVVRDLVKTARRQLGYERRVSEVSAMELDDAALLPDGSF